MILLHDHVAVNHALQLLAKAYVMKNNPQEKKEPRDFEFQYWILWHWCINYKGFHLFSLKTLTEKMQVMFLVESALYLIHHQGCGLTKNMILFHFCVLYHIPFHFSGKWTLIHASRDRLGIRDLCPPVIVCITLLDKWAHRKIDTN